MKKEKADLGAVDTLLRFLEKDVSSRFGPSYRLSADGRRFRGPIRSSIIWVSGAKRGILNLVPSEEIWFVVIGSFILITTVIAGAGATATVSYVLYGDLRYDPFALAFGLFWAAVIFAFDRALVRMPMNPVRLTENAMDVIWGHGSAKPSSLSKAFRTSWLDAPRVFLTSLPRLIVAIASAVVFAETLLFIYFEQDLKPVLEAVATAKHAALVDQQANVNKSESDSLDKQIASWIAANLPKVATLQSDLEKLRARETVLTTDEGILNRAASYEAEGKTGTFTTSKGTVSLTGTIGDGPATRTIEEWAKATRTELVENRGSQESKTDLINGELEAAKTSSKSLQDLLQRKAALSVPAADPVIKGIGVRMDALHQYEMDMDASTPGILDKAEGCGGDAWQSFACTLQRSFVQPTPRGPIVAAIRWGLLFIELAPIFAKFAFVLRLRRPYDTLTAVEELIANGASVRLAGEQLARTGAVLEVQGSQNQAIRTAAGTDLYLVNAQVGTERRPPWLDRIRRENPWRVGSWHLFDLRRRAEELEDLNPQEEA